MSKRKPTAAPAPASPSSGPRVNSPAAGPLNQTCPYCKPADPPADRLHVTEDQETGLRWIRLRCQACERIYVRREALAAEPSA